MTRKNGRYLITEQGTTQYADLNMAQALALAAVAEALVTTIRAAAADKPVGHHPEEGTTDHGDEQ